MAALRAILGALGAGGRAGLSGFFQSQHLLFGAAGRQREGFVCAVRISAAVSVVGGSVEQDSGGAGGGMAPVARATIGIAVGQFRVQPGGVGGDADLSDDQAGGAGLEVCGLGSAMQAMRAAGRSLVKRDPHWDMLGDIPHWPGRLGGLFRKDLREMLSLLDPYAAALLSLCGSAYRIFAAHPDPAAFSIMSLLAALAMSTCAQSPFGLDGGAGVTRYRLARCAGGRFCWRKMRRCWRFYAWCCCRWITRRG